MTISSQTRIAGPYTGNGVTTSFPFSFKVFTTADLLVVRTDLSAVESTLVLGTDYTVTLNSNQNANPGGNVALSSALTTSFLLTLTSTVGYLQPTDLTNQGGFYPSVINDSLDRMTILTQQLSEQVNRSVKVNISSSVSPTALINTIIAGAASATTSAANAATSASNASTSATAASSSATAASSSATSATAQATAASVSAANAATSASTATSQATTATTQATTATTQAGIATTQAANASTSATSASTSATNAATSATTASTAATTATTQATAAGTSATNAATSETNAAASAASVGFTLTSVSTLTNKTLTNPTVTNYVESVVAIGNSGTTQTLSLTSGTVQTVTMTGNCTFTMPTATAGKSFILICTQDGTGSRTAVFTSVKFPNGAAPALTTTATTGVDILTFVANGTSWFGTAAQAFA